MQFVSQGLQAKQPNALQLKRKQGILIAAHRGTSGGNIIQNTCMAYANSLLHGADMIELDVIRSTDGEFFVFHDGMEHRIWGTERDIRTMSSKEIESLPCRNRLDAPTGQRVERLGHVLERFRGKCLINVDRGWPWWEDLLEYLKTFDMENQLLLKSHAEEKLLETLQRCGNTFMYMPILFGREDWDRVRRYQIRTVAAELIFDREDHPLIDPAFLKSLHEEGVLLWVNALTLDDRQTLSAYLDDDHAVRDGFDAAWGRLLDMGFDIIQTDWPALLRKYADARRAEGKL